jgi:predicted dehydrogenase
VAVGAVGMSVPRREFYPKELELVVSCSYGPGRYDVGYEERGLDYPYSYVRWTEQRNIGAVLEQIAAKRLDVGRLTTHTIEVAQAEGAYRLMEGRGEDFLGIVLTYPPVLSLTGQERRVSLGARQAPHTNGAGEVGVGFVGAGNFASLVLLPKLSKIKGVKPRSICSAGGVSATVRGEQFGFEEACTSIDLILSDDKVDAIFLATRHDLHSGQALAALRRGKHVFIEKPLAIDARQLDEFARGLEELGNAAPIWTVGFNRRFSPAASAAADFFRGVSGPRTLNYRFNAGPIPSDHWTQDLSVGGGRLVGEACHAIDLAAFLFGSQVVRVYAEAVTPGGAAGAGDDQTAFVARFADGSVASINYFAGGDKAFPKERIELFGGSRVAVIDDFKTVTLSKGGHARVEKMRGRDKGHDAELEAFVGAVRAGGQPPIPYGSILNVSWASLSLMESVQTGMPVNVPVF